MTFIWKWICFNMFWLLPIFSDTKQTFYQKNVIFFVSLPYSASFSIVDVPLVKGIFFLKQINSESLFCPLSSSHVQMRGIEHGFRWVLLWMFWECFKTASKGNVSHGLNSVIRLTIKDGGLSPLNTTRGFKCGRYVSVFTDRDNHCLKKR